MDEAVEIIVRLKDGRVLRALGASAKGFWERANKDKLVWTTNEDIDYQFPKFTETQ